MERAQLEEDALVHVITGCVHSGGLDGMARLILRFFGDRVEGLRFSDEGSF
jgi:hypothetical protein